VTPKPPSLLVPTEYTRATATAVGDLVRHHAMGCVYGEAGLGKTFSVAAAVTGARQAEPLLRTCSDRFPAGWTRNEIAIKLLAAMTGDPDHRGNLQRLSLSLAEHLSQGRWLVVIDEAQNLTRLAMDFLRYLHDEPSTRFALLLVGGNGCYQTLCREPMLRSRIYWWVEFRPLTRAEVLALVRGLHPMYRDASDELLSEIDELACHGQWRAWAQFTIAALDLVISTGRPGIDDEIAGNVLYQFTGGREHAR
jgi:type II secretory pathway predicted ATPase ExeA